MKLFRLSLFIIFSTSLGCVEKQEAAISEDNPATSQANRNYGALLLSDFSSMEGFEEVVDIKYKKVKVVLTHGKGQNQVTSILKTGVQESDFNKARDGSFWDRARLGLRTPYAVFNRADIISVEILGRRRNMMFGEGDVAFYDLAEQTVVQIREEDRSSLSEKELSEKGYLNTFNHITAQALITSLFSARLADYISDVHERHTMPELISGDFSVTQLKDVENGPVDNYLDMVNNEWGQALGIQLKAKHNINATTVWTPELLADYMNDVQNYYSHVYDLSFLPFSETDELIFRFSNKINAVRNNVDHLVKTYY